MSDHLDNPCLACGACCTTYRVSFYWAEGQARGVPLALTEQLSPHLACMAGTNAARPRCAALHGPVGGPIACGIYDQRPEPCRELRIGDDQCRRARAHHGLPALASPLPLP